jgi:UDP-glucose 4-epimerase
MNSDPAIPRCPVLVTGGAGYIGSHAVLALLDRGWPVAVVDNLSTGFRFAVPEGVAFYQGDIADAGLMTRIFAEQGTRAVMHFAGSIVPCSLRRSWRAYRTSSSRARRRLTAFPPSRRSPRAPRSSR